MRCQCHFLLALRAGKNPPKAHRKPTRVSSKSTSQPSSNRIPISKLLTVSVNQSFSSSKSRKQIPFNQTYVHGIQGQPIQQLQTALLIIIQMYFTKATVLTLFTAIPLTLPSPILENRQKGVTCQTSSGSPITIDVTGVINQLRGKGGNYL